MENLQLNLFEETNAKKPNTKPDKRYIQQVRENLAYYSVEQTSIADLLAIILGRNATPEICGKLSAIGLRELSKMSIEQYTEKFGISKMAAMKMYAVFGIAKKMSESKREEFATIRTPRDAADFMMEELRYLDQEHFVIALLNIKKRVIAKKTIFIGTLSASIVHPREVFREAITRSAASIICFHNHPSGNPKPSPEDILITERLADVGRTVGIEVVDHVIIGDGVYYSFRENGRF